MKRILLLLLATLPLMADAIQPAVERAVKQAEAGYTQALLKGDSAALSRLLTDDLMYTHADLRLDTKDSLVNDIKTGKYTYTAVDLADSTMRQYGDTVVTTHRATIVTKQTGSRKLYVTHVWVKRPNGWLLASRQSSPVPEGK